MAHDGPLAPSDGSTPAPTVVRTISVHAVLGNRLDPAFDGRLHDLEHLGRLERVTVATADLARRRLRAIGSLGTEFLIALPRDVALSDGAVIALSADHAAIISVDAERWLRLTPRSAEDALELGYHAGNLHWRVRFSGADLLVALEGPVEAYVARIAPLIEAGGVDVFAEEP